MHILTSFLNKLLTNETLDAIKQGGRINLNLRNGQNGPNIVWKKKKRTVLRKIHFWFCSAVSGM
jgi:hypothetical protein